MLTLGDLEGPDRVRGSVGLGVVSCTSQPFCGMKSWGKTVSESGVAESRAYAVSNNGGGGKIPNPPTNREKCYRSKIVPRFDMERVLKASCLSPEAREKNTARSFALVNNYGNEVLRSPGEYNSPHPNSHLGNNLTSNIESQRS